MEFCTETVASDKVMKIGLVKLMAMTFMLLLYAFDYFGNKVIMSPVVNAFRRFTDDQGDFKKELVNEVHEMLSLYEAAQFRVHGEEILDEALTFTITQLKLILPKLSNSQLAQQISNALKFSIKDGVVRVETRKCISFYQENHESSNQVLLNFAKLDFNIVQRLHKKELSDLTRWNIDASEPLPSYMKIIYGYLLNTYNEIEKELANENKIISNRLFQRGDEKGVEGLLSRGKMVSWQESTNNGAVYKERNSNKWLPIYCNYLLLRHGKVELYNKPRIFYHKEGYFVVLFVNIEDRNEVIYSSPYTMNNRPMIVKSWAADFTFHEERWTSINHPKSITVQGPCGRILEQQVDYDWTPLYRNTCLMIGYVCPIRGQRNIEAKQVEPTQKEQPPRQRNYPKRDKRRKTKQNQCAQKLDELMTISLQAFTVILATFKLHKIPHLYLCHTRSPMDPPDFALSVRLDGQIVASSSVVTPKEGFAGKTSYANSVTTKSGSTLPERKTVLARQTTHNGMPAVIFKVSDYYGVMAAEVFDNFNVFTDFSNEEDFNSVWYKGVLTIDGQQMWLQKWLPDFKPEEDLPIALVWVLLPALPFHLHTWHYIKQQVSNVGTPLEMDNTTRSQARPSIVKVRVEIDLLKTLPDVIWVGLENETSPLRGYTQKKLE
ncbi:hypothetical protein FXO37_23975 [Capsicum annuum]|nr:hypothetical protein FXO37_23975 [Capsicum annuum]